MSDLKGKTIALLLEKAVNDREFWYPYYRLKEAGATVVVAGPEAGKTYPAQAGVDATSEKAFKDLKADELDGVVVPGGYAPDHIRRSEDCLKLLRELNAQNKLVAFICHAGWVPISAGILKGRKATSVSAIKDDMINAGCLWENNSLVCDGNIISSRTPDDLPEFMKGVIAFLSK